MTKREAREALTSEYINQILDYGERVLPESSARLRAIKEALVALGVGKSLPGVITMLNEELNVALEYEAEAQAQV